MPEPGSSPARRTPTISRSHAAGTASARGLLLTLLGEFVLTNGGRAWTSAVIAAFARLGVEEKATRQALMRTAAAGWLTAEKSGRRTRWRLTGHASKLLTEGAERIYSFTGPAENWDGHWLVVSARIPESDRSTRHAVGRKLSWAGFGSIAPGLWVSPHVERETEAVLVLRDAGITDAHVFAATRRGLADVREMIRTAWDLAAVEEQYEQFLVNFGDPNPADVLTRQLELVHAWRKFPAIDPALPRELLPPRWSGLQAAELFADRHQRWSEDARLEWKRLNSDG